MNGLKLELCTWTNTGLGWTWRDRWILDEIGDDYIFDYCYAEVLPGISSRLWLGISHCSTRLAVGFGDESLPRDEFRC